MRSAAMIDLRRGRRFHRLTVRIVLTSTCIAGAACSALALLPIS
jgi:hypothetical protein